MLVVSLENQTNMSGFLMVGQFFLTIWKPDQFLNGCH
jgi:hypothetical protein